MQTVNINALENVFELNLPTRLFFGETSLQKLPELCEKIGCNVLLVTSKDLQGQEDAVLSLFDRSKFSMRTFYVESPEPTCSFIDAAAADLRALKIDCLIGLGGGSAIDLAKALSIALTHPKESIWMYANLSNRPPLPLAAPLIPVFAIPTTSGTGAEVTPYAVLTKPDTQQKGTIQEPSIFPKASFLNPRFMQSMPPDLTASTGFDALAHAFEAFINVSKVAPVAEWAAREAIRVIFETLPSAVQNPQDLFLRTRMGWAASIAGVAISHRGTTTTHAIAEPLGVLTHIPHGHAVAISTLPVMKRTWKSQISKFSELYTLVRRDRNEQKSDEYRAEAFVEETTRLLSDIKLNRNAVSYLKVGAAEGLNTKLLDNVLTFKFRPLKQHPLEFSKEQLSEIIEEIIHGN